MENLLAYVVTGVVSFVVGVLLINFQPKAKVVHWSPHSFLFKLTKENVVLQTDALTIQNIGRKQADNVELLLENEPDFYQFAPSVSYKTEKLDNGHFLIRIPTLGPNEHVTLQILSYKTVPKALNLRSAAGQASAMPFQIARVWPKWLPAVVWVLLVVGLGFSAYWLITAVIFLSRAIGIV